MAWAVTAEAKLRASAQLRPSEKLSKPLTGSRLPVPRPLQNFVSQRQTIRSSSGSKITLSMQIWERPYSFGFELAPQIYLVSLGDSRIYLYRQEGLFLLTFDQVIENELRKKGVSREQAARSQGAAYLSRCILANRICVPDVLETKISQGDVWLLCSDGLTREVASDEISAALDAVRSDGPEACVEVLIQKAVNNGGRDNVTVVIAHFAD